MQYNLIKSMKNYFCHRNILLGSHLMFCELTCFNKSFIVYYFPLSWQWFQNLAIKTGLFSQLFDNDT